MYIIAKLSHNISVENWWSEIDFNNQSRLEMQIGLNSF